MLMIELALRKNSCSDKVMTRYPFLIVATVTTMAAALLGCKPSKDIPKPESNASLATSASSNGSSTAPATSTSTQTPLMASAEVNPLQGSNVHGTVQFIQDASGTRVIADITGLSPGEHGFHIHEKGDCSAPDGSSAGSHFNPSGTQHGAPGTAPHHAGDLGNLIADASGNAHLEVTSSDFSLDGPNSILNRSVIVHAKKDDLATQPSGDSGGKIGCGVIQKK
jgi:Cu-Zn family superoxide dismutase